MRPLSEFPSSDLASVSHVLTDIDDTMTTDGRLPSTSLRAMEELEAKGVHVIPVTGRPAGWCDHIARMWPVAAVVGENGALYFSYDRSAREMQTWFARAEKATADREALALLADKVLREVPGSALASDQPYRLTDLAVDFCEDVPRLNEVAVGRIVDILTAGGATTKVSSIHVNAWFGEHDKLTTSLRCLQDLFEMDEASAQATVIFSGDSPNDEPMFKFFRNSVGVANVRNFSLRHPPGWVTKSMSAEGFAEMAFAILNAKRNHRNG
ncbi:MAG: HAD-IIB family hydrolase [Puniceicoccaceae bacterium]